MTPADVQRAAKLLTDISRIERFMAGVTSQRRVDVYGESLDLRKYPETSAAILACAREQIANIRATLAEMGVA